MMTLPPFRAVARSIPLTCVLALVGLPGVASADADELTIRVPHRTAERAAIRALKFRLDLDLQGETPTFEVEMFEGPPGPGARMLLQPLPAYDDPACIDGYWCDRDVGDGRVVTVSLGDQEREGDQLRATLFVRPEESRVGCGSRMTGDEWFVIRVEGATIAGACLEVFDNAEACAQSTIVVPGDPRDPDTYPRLIDPASLLHTPTHTCAGWRPPLDLAMVLDISGSMGSDFQPNGLIGGSKLDVARLLLEQFARIWQAMREDETEPCGAMIFDPERPCDSVEADRDDAFGLVPFDHDAHPELGTDGMLRLGDLLGAGWGDFEGVIGALEPQGATSIGDGLAEAFGPRFLDLPAVARAEARGDYGPLRRRRKVALVISDGKTNSATHVRADDDSIAVSPNGRDWLPLGFGLDDVPIGFDALRRWGVIAEAAWRAQIYTITVGAGPGNVDARIMSNLARVTHGAYHHVDQRADVYSPELHAVVVRALQNFLRFNTWRVVREMEGQVVGFSQTLDVLGVHPADHRRASTRFQLPQTAQAVSVVAMYDPAANDHRVADAQLGLELIPPPGIDAPEPAVGAGLVSLTMKLPRDGRDHRAWGDWGIQLFQLDAEQPVPVKVMVLVDTLGVETATAVLTDDPAVGERIVVETRLGALGRPIDDLGGGAVWLSVREPEHALGERMLDPANRAGLDPTRLRLAGAGDAGHHQATLREALAEVDPSAYDRRWSRLPMLDDGVGADRIAGDGVYTTGFTTLRAGQHELVTTVVGRNHPEVGGFDFQHGQTIFVHEVPAPFTVLDLDGRADMPAYTIDDAAGQGGAIERTVSYTPRNRFGDRLGPGHEGAIFVRTAPGDLLPLVDPDLDGTYETTLTLARADAYDGAGEPHPPELVWSDTPNPVLADDPAAVESVGADAVDPDGIVELKPDEAAAILRDVSRACDCSATDSEPTSLALCLLALALGGVRRWRR